MNSFQETLKRERVVFELSFEEQGGGHARQR